MRIDQPTTDTTNITDTTNKRFCTDAQKTVISNTSGTNTGDNATNSQYSGLVSNATHTGDATGATALTVKGINGTLLSTLATGILKNTTATGVPSIAVAADFPTLNQNTTGSSASCTGNSATATSATSATSATTATNLAGGSGGTIPYQTASGATAMLANGTVGQVLQSNGTTTAPSWVTAAGGGNAQTANPLSQFATTTSAQLAGVMSDETGSGALVFATSPTLVTPILGTPTSGTLTNCIGLPVAGGGTGVATLTAYAPIFGGTTSTSAVQSGTVGTAGQVLTSNGAGALPTFQAAGGGSGGIVRNILINGGMEVDQRNNGASQTFTAGAALAYSVDRWYGYCTGANVTGQRVAGSAQSKYRYQFTGAASVTAIGFAQRIESLNSYQLNNTTATLSVDLANSLLTTVTWTAYYANTENTFGTLASPTKTQIATGTFTVNSTVTRYSTNISIPSAATTGIEILFTVGAQTSGTFTVGNAQLESGSTANAFEYRDIAIEKVMCQRYLPAIAPNTASYNVMSGGLCISTTQFYATIIFPVPARVAVTGITVTTAATTFLAYTATGSGAAVNALALDNGGVYAATVLCTVNGTPLISGNSTVLLGSSTATTSTAILFTGAEL